MRFHATLGVQFAADAEIARHALVAAVSRVRGSAELVAFGFGPTRLHLVLDGDDAAVAHMLGRVGRSVRHRQGVRAPLLLRPGVELLPAVAEAHRAVLELGVLCPLDSPWSSHRDAMGYRRSPWYDANVLGDLDRRALHALAGGRALAEGWPLAAPPREPLDVLFNVACEVHGHLPGDRRAFPLFAQLAREQGWRPLDVAGALRLTRRRVHQLLHVPQPGLDVARRWLGHRRAVA
jgi:hypothetical protein